MKSAFMRKTILILLTIIGVCTACQRNEIYNEFHSFSTDGWHQDSVLRYSIDITDSLAKYDILITLRHNNTYPYQNMWMFVDEWYGGLLLNRDTIECDMADAYGRWFGAGVSTFELPLLYTTSHPFAQTGEYVFTIQQGMRTEYLRGISNVGLQVVKHNGKE